MKPGKRQAKMIAALKAGSLLQMRHGQWELDGKPVSQPLCMSLFERGYIMAQGEDADGRWVYRLTTKGEAV
jgi:hypothetical protein